MGQMNHVIRFWALPRLACQKERRSSLIEGLVKVSIDNITSLIPFSEGNQLLGVQFVEELRGQLKELTEDRL
jgi:hypothetical protein